MSVDNPYYFSTELPPHLMSPPSPAPHNQQPPPKSGFSFFRRRSSSSSSGCTASSSAAAAAANKSPATIKSPNAKAKTFNSATLGAEAAILGSRRSSLSSLFRPQPVAPVPTQPPPYYSFGPASLPMNGLYADPRHMPALRHQQHQQQQQQMQMHHQQQQQQQRIGLRMQRQAQQQAPPSIRTRHESFGDNDDVFLQSGPTSLNGMQSMHYPAESCSSVGLRRHSIGTSVRNGAERVRCGSLSDEVPKSYAPRPPVPLTPPSASSSSSPQSATRNHHHHHHHHRLNHRRPTQTQTTPNGGYCFNGNAGTSGQPGAHDDMDDILIVTARQSEPAILWANYLKTRFDKITKQRGRKPFNFLHIKIDEEPITADLSRRCHTTKLQIVILCPALVALPEHFLQSQLSVCLRPDIVLGILLDVPEERIATMHRQAFPAYRRWRRCVVPSAAQTTATTTSAAAQHDQQSLVMAKVLGIATDILGRALCQRPLCNTAVSPTVATDKCHGLGVASSGAGGHGEAFTVLPRKVKIGQAKVVALLSEPLGRDDTVRVLIEKTGVQLDVIGLKRRNPYTLQFTIPDGCMEVSTMIEIRILRNDRELGRRPVKCESRLRELEQLLRGQDSPMAFMCQALGVLAADRAALDAQLVHAFQRNVPAGFHLLAGAGGASATKVAAFAGREAAGSSVEEFPTLLHFAAGWGLEQLAVQLMEMPGGEVAGEMRNGAGRTPAEMAEGAGHAKLAASLKSFAQMHELSTMYHYFKGISSSGPDDGDNDTAPGNVQLEAVRKPSTSATIRSEEYMEMNASQSDDTTSVSDINAVTNLNYINIDSIKDEEIARNLNEDNDDDDEDHNNDTNDADCNDTKVLNTVVDSAAMTSEMRIQEPAYHDSQATNPKADDAFSQDCLNVLENCSGQSRSASSMSSTSTTASPPPKAHHTSPPPMSPTPSLGDYMLHPSNIPVLPCKPASGATCSDYMMQPSNRPVCPEETDAETVAKPVSSFAAPLESRSASGAAKGATLSRQESNVSKASTSAASVDEELLEIMNDFKNNVFTIQEVEQLVDSWKARNDVRQSYKDKELQLARMRQEYERVQATLREKMKHRPTPFERMRKLFSRNKQQQQQQQANGDDGADDGGAVGGSDVSGGSSSKGRPRSSLSLQSLSSSTSSTTSSSGRLSTGSACSGTSLGDSGTHSDPEEQRRGTGGASGLLNGGSCRIGSPGSLLLHSSSMSDDYLHPPTPRPVSQPALHTPTTPDATAGRYFVSGAATGPQKPTTLNLHSSISLEGGENYAMFPSNVPVIASPTSPLPPLSASSTSSGGHGHHDYMNFSGLNTIEEAKESVGPSAGNIVSLQPIKIRTPDEIYGSTGFGSGHHSSNSSSSSTLNGAAAAVMATSSGAGGKRPSLGDLCSSFKPLSASTASATASADAQSVRFQKGANGAGSLDGLDRRTHESLAQLTRSIDVCNATINTAKVAKVTKSGTKAKLCKSSSSPSVGATFSMAEEASRAGGQHDYMNV